MAKTSLSKERAMGWGKILILFIKCNQFPVESPPLVATALNHETKKKITENAENIIFLWHLVGGGGK